MLNLLQYDFVVRGLVAGVVMALIAPVIGIFLVLRRYSLIADTLAHVSLAGIALGLLIGVNPLFTAIGATVTSSVVIERLRRSRDVYGESALALFLSGSLAVAVVLLGLAHGFNASLFSYLFGSIVTVSMADLSVVVVLGLVVLALVGGLYKELIYLTFDEESARVSGINAGLVNTVFIILAALTISLAIPIVGVLLIAALLVIPVVSALQLRKSFWPTVFIAQAMAVFSVVSGVIISFYLNLPSGGTIVLVTLLIFLVVQTVGNRD